MRVIKNSVLCFVMVSMMSVSFVQARNSHSRLQDGAQLTPVKSPVSSYENKKAALSLHNGLTAGVSSELNGESSLTFEGRPTAATVSLQLADNTAGTEKDEKSVTSAPEQTTTEKRQTSPTTENGIALKKGIGIQSGIRFHRPETFNTFLTEYWSSFIPEQYDGSVAKKRIGPGLFLTLNGTIDIGPLFHITPFAQGMWSGKQFFFRGGVVKDVHVNSYTGMGGLNLWVRLLNHERITLRLGAGAYGGYTIVSFTGDINGNRISGGGYGFRGLLGTELRLNRHVVLTFDCSVPYGVSKITNDGSLKTPGGSVEYPSKLEHFGFELLPGVMFYF